jgi:hypothetical protein
LKKFAMVAVAALLATIMLPLFGGSADATIHPLTSAECAARQSATGAGEDQDPPGISDETNQQTFARPIFATLAAGALTLDDHGSANPNDWTWGGPAYNGDNGDEHCANPQGGSHAD